MAQQRFFNWEADDYTDSFNRQQLAPIPPGLYRGFELDPTTSGLNLKLYHDLTGYRETDDSLTISPRLGMVRSKQGVNVIEDAAITILVTSNSANAEPRIDIIAMEHEYTQITGGTTAGYIVIPGTPATSPLPPGLTFPEKQVLMGYLYWPAGAIDLSDPGIVYTKVAPPRFNDDVESVLLTGWQIVTGRKTFQHITQLQNPLTYNIGTQALTSSVDSNQYFFPNSSTNYIEVSTLTLPWFTALNTTGFETNRICIRTLQRLRFISGGNIDVIDPIHIEAGETVEFIVVAGPGMTYYLVRGNEVRKDKATKMFSQFVQAMGTATVDLSGGIINLDGKGNYYEVSFDFAATILQGISDTSALTDFFGPGSEAGGMICLKLINTNVDPSTTGTFLEGLSLIGGKKGVEGFGGSDMVLNDGDMMFLVEHSTHYSMVSYSGPVVNVLKLHNDYHAFIQPEEHKWNKTQSTGWKVLAPAAFNPTTGVLAITDEGNSFSALITTGDVGAGLKDIQIKRGSAAAVPVPEGLIVSIKFTMYNYVVGVSEPSYIDLSPSSNITSAISDFSKFPTGSVNVLHMIGDTYPNSDVFTFRKSNGKWDIIATAEQPDVWARIKALDAIQYAAGTWHTVGAAGEPAYTTGAGTIRFKKDTHNVIRFDGTYTNVTTSTGVFSLFTLPSGYAPVANRSFPVVIAGSPDDVGYVTVSTTGLVLLKIITSSAIGVTVYLDSVNYQV